MQGLFAIPFELAFLQEVFITQDNFEDAAAYVACTAPQAWV